MEADDDGAVVMLEAVQPEDRSPAKVPSPEKATLTESPADADPPPILEERGKRRVEEVEAVEPEVAQLPTEGPSDFADLQDLPEDPPQEPASDGLEFEGSESEEGPVFRGSPLEVAMDGLTHEWRQKLRQGLSEALLSNLDWIEQAKSRSIFRVPARVPAAEARQAEELSLSDVEGLLEAHAAPENSQEVPKPMGEVAHLLSELAKGGDEVTAEDYWVRGEWDIDGLRDDVALVQLELKVKQERPTDPGEPDPAGLAAVRQRLLKRLELAELDAEVAQTANLPESELNWYEPLRQGPESDYAADSCSDAEKFWYSPVAAEELALPPPPPPPMAERPYRAPVNGSARSSARPSG